MTTSQFTFLKDDFPNEFAEARRAEQYVLGDPRASVWRARLVVELSCPF